MSGSLVLNTSPTTPLGHSRQLKAELLKELLMNGMVGGEDIPTLGFKDAQVLEKNSRYGDGDGDGDGDGGK